MANRFWGAVVVATAATLVLTGCTVATLGAKPTPTPTASAVTEEQTVAEACDVLKTKLLAVSEDLAASLEGIQNDPTAAMALLASVADELDVALESVSNEEITAVGDTASESLRSFTTLIGDFLANPTTDTTAITEAVTQMQTDLAAIDTACR